MSERIAIKKSGFSHLLTAVMFVLPCLLCFMCTFFIFQKDTSEHGCTPLFKGFTNKDLVGTWIAHSSVQGITDTLYIRADGTYKQIIHMGKPNPVDIDYEGNWQQWRFEPRPNGTGYLYMEGLRGCAADPEYSCDWINDGTVPQADACESKWMEPDPVGEEVLVVYGFSSLGPNEKISHPFTLTLFRGFESSSWDYYFIEP
jgi:hypothetical protein